VSLTTSSAETQDSAAAAAAAANTVQTQFDQFMAGLTGQ